jgi:hypothetical protein
MDLKKQLLQSHSKVNCDLVVNWVGDSQQKFDELFQLFLCKEERLVQVSSWPLSYCVEAYPVFIKKYYPILFAIIQKPNNHAAVNRHILRILQFVEIPKKYEGITMNFCFDFIQDITEKTGVKVFSLVILENLVKKYPEIKEELRIILETQLPHESAGVKNRGHKLLKKL